MKTYSFLLAVVTFLWCGISLAATREDAAYGLIKRMAPQISERFSVELMDGQNTKDVFEIESAGDKIVLRGNNVVAIASGFHWYLKYYCNLHFSWNGRQLNYPRVLPAVKPKFRKEIQPEYRVYMNYCTFNYSASWWDWERWQWEIDFMAMNGINMPLAVVGLEGVWYKSLLRVGLSDEEARSFLVGPAFFAWQWMTNIESFGGPLPKKWIDDHIALGKKIISRERELGMTPIQQGFSGYVPRIFKSKFPTAKIQESRGWAQGSFLPAAQLDPLDPLFEKFGKIFLEEERNLFGTYGWYAADPFHEGVPPSNDSSYLAAVGRQITNLLVNFDHNAKWVMQAWSLRKPIATSVPKSRLLILDLNGSKWKSMEGYWGYDFVVGNLHNFGGRINLHGDLQWVAANQYQKTKKVHPNAVGYGLFMEGITQNPVYYDLAFEVPLHTDSIDLKSWLHNYAKRRYGATNQIVDAAWQLLLSGPYRPGTNGVEKSSIIAARPALHVKKSGPNDGLVIPYDPLQLRAVLSRLLREQETLKSSDAFCFDVVDIERQLLSNLGQEIHKKAAAAFENKNLPEFDLHSRRFIDLLSDVDQLLSTRAEYSFDKWITDARKWGSTPGERALYDYNASMLVTLWGGNTNDSSYALFDYAWREWGGLIKGYYLQRWQQFYDMLRQHLKNGTAYTEVGLPLVWGRERFRANGFYNRLADWEISWAKKEKAVSPVKGNGALVTANALFRKYQPLMKVYYQ